MWLLIAFIAVPLIEIALFIQVGGFIGLWPTLLIVIVTAVLGARLVKSHVKVADFSANQGMYSAHPHQRDPRQPQDRVIDGDFEDVTPTHDSPKGPSGWTQH